MTPHVPQVICLKSLCLQQFRSYKEANFSFSPGINIIYGQNGIGKTNLLEAIYYLMVGRSFRPGMGQDLIQNGASSFYLEAIFSKHEVEQKICLYSAGKERKIIYNNTTLPSISHLLGLIQGVIMTPDDVLLIKGSPAIRRQFLDLQLIQADPLYLHYLTRYTKAMGQRGQLLKQKKTHSIEVWEQEMAEAAVYIIQKRKNIIETLRERCNSFYSYLTETTESLSLTYCSGVSACKNGAEIKDYHLLQFSKNRPREFLFGYTLFGPHKDDFRVTINERDARLFASEGEQRSSVAALKVAEWEGLKLRADITPLCMIDDIGISLDNKRRERLLKSVANLGQVFITTTDSTVADFLKGSGNNTIKTFAL